MHFRECILVGMYSLECISKIEDPNTGLVNGLVDFLGNCLYFLGGYFSGLSIYACLDRMCTLFFICLTQ
jgi:hypothetical protein